jgi:hypothetical protein
MWGKSGEIKWYESLGNKGKGNKRVCRYILNERVGITVTLETCIREVPGSNLSRDTEYPEAFLDFSQAYRTMRG